MRRRRTSAATASPPAPARRPRQTPTRGWRAPASSTPPAAPAPAPPSPARRRGPALAAPARANAHAMLEMRKWFELRRAARRLLGHRVFLPGLVAAGAREGPRRVRELDRPEILDAREALARERVEERRRRDVRLREAPRRVGELHRRERLDLRLGRRRQRAPRGLRNADARVRHPVRDRRQRARVARASAQAASARARGPSSQRSCSSRNWAAPGSAPRTSLPSRLQKAPTWIGATRAVVPR